MQFRKEKRQQVTLDLTPLIDVVFLLLIFFMLTTTFATSKTITINLPEAKTGESADPNNQIITVTIDSQGAYFIQGQNIPEKELKNALLTAIGNDHQRVLSLLADRKTSHGTVVQVMDIARSLGLNQMVIETQTVTKIHTH